MKPGNLSERMLVPNPAAKRKMRIRYNAHRVFGVRFFHFEVRRKEYYNGKKTVYL